MYRNSPDWLTSSSTTIFWYLPWPVTTNLYFLEAAEAWRDKKTSFNDGNRKKRLKRWRTAWNRHHLAYLFGRVSDLLPQVFFLHHISRFHILITIQNQYKDGVMQRRSVSTSVWSWWRSVSLGAGLQVTPWCSALKLSYESFLHIRFSPVTNLRRTEFPNGNDLIHLVKSL